MILSGESIRSRGIVSPCDPKTEHLGLTYGLGIAGYDVRCEFDKQGSADHIIITREEFRLVSTIELFTMPNNVVGVVHDKSTWARCGLVVQNTVIEPGWTGHLTLELSNHSTFPLHINRGVGIAQVVFHEVDHYTEGYDGKYQNQERGPQRAR